MVSIKSYIIENDAEFKRELDKALSQVEDLSFAFREISRDWFKSNVAQFTLKGSGQYQPLSALYAQRKRKLVGEKPIMVSSGRLRDSISGTPNRDSILKIGKNYLIMGTKVPYGIYHQSDAPRRIIPLRKFLFIGPEAPRTATSRITGRLERFLKILEFEVQRQLDK